MSNKDPNLEAILACPYHTPIKRMFSITTGHDHRLLLPPSEDSYFSGIRKEVGAENLFIQALNIPTILQNLFSFRNPETYQTVIDVIKKVDCSQAQLRYEREEFLKPLMENEDLDKIGSLFASYHHLEAQKHFSDSHESSSQSISRRHPILKEQMKVLEKIIELTPGTPIEELQAQIDKTRKSDWFQGLEEGDRRRGKGVYDNYDLLARIRHALSGNIRDTLDYFVGFANGFVRLKENGANVIFAELVHLSGYKYCNIQDGVNPVLYIGENANKEKIPNDFFTDEMSSVKVITGENEYGKTIAIKTKGIIQAFAQAGLPVIAKRAVLTPVDKILANIGLTEDTVKGKSTYANINTTTYDLVEAATKKSLLILDEPTSGTYDLKAIRQGEVYIREIAQAGYEAWIVTHHLELTDLADEVPEIFNLTTEVRDGKPTYKLIEGVFQPTDDNVNLEYPLEKVQAATIGKSSRKIPGGTEQFPSAKSLNRQEMLEGSKLPEHLKGPLEEYLSGQEMVFVKN